MRLSSTTLQRIIDTDFERLKQTFTRPGGIIHRKIIRTTKQGIVIGPDGEPLEPGSGDGYNEATVDTEIPGVIKWISALDPQIVPLGDIDVGDCIIAIAKSDYERIDAKVDRLIIDNIDVKISNVIGYKGLGDTTEVELHCKRVVDDG